MKPGVKSKNDVAGAAPRGDAPTTSEWSTILLPIKVHLILETWRYSILYSVGGRALPTCDKILWQWKKKKCRQQSFSWSIFDPWMIQADPFL